MNYVTDEDFDYAVFCRRAFHRHPELLFDLPRTTEFVRGELTRMGIRPAGAGPAAITGTLGPDGAKTVIGIRADMDALPITEKTGLPYASEVPGVMHACGHDSHTAVLLTCARILKRHENDLRVRVRFLFQPSEEGAESGAKSMVEHGAAEDADLFIAAHCDSSLDTGTIGICPGNYMAASTLVHVVFHGKKAHAAQASQGADAIAMAAGSYGALNRMAAEEAGERPYLFGINCFRGGTSPNTVADRCEMDAAFRWYDDSLYENVREKCEAICRKAAHDRGGRAELDWRTSAPPVRNDPALTKIFISCMEKTFQRKPVILPPSLLSEDFSWFLREKPGFLFRFGVRNEEAGCTAPLHSEDFRLDEQGMAFAAEAFVSFILRFDDPA